jgi:hypothetical protein
MPFLFIANTAQVCSSSKQTSKLLCLRKIFKKTDNILFSGAHSHQKTVPLLHRDNTFCIFTFSFNIFSPDGRAQRTSYLGGTDEDAESAWMWLDGTPWEYTHWREGEPNGDRGENCLLLDLDAGSHGEWIDIDCAGRGGREEGYVCSYVNGKFMGIFIYFYSVYI